MPKKTLRAQALELLQLLRRLEEADDNGYCSCVSCGVKKHYKEMDGGHYIPKGHSSYWALEEENVWPQCKGCNGFGMKHGTALHTYTMFMQNQFGDVFVENMIKTKKDIKKRYTSDYRALIADFKKRIKVHQKRVGG